MYHIDRVQKKTEYQSKKHYTQFTPSENALIEIILSKMQHENVHISRHAKEHILINKTLVYDTLSDCKVIEFNLTCKPERNCCRVLIRCNKNRIDNIEGYEQQTNLCLVLDIITNSVVSAYLNIADDTHNNINWGKYTDNLDIITIAKMMRGV